MADLATIVADLAVALARVDGLGVDRVIRGWRTVPVRVPLATISVARWASEQGPVMGQYLRSVSVDVQVWRQVTAPEPGALARGAEALADEVHYAIEQARSDSSSSLYVLPTFEVVGTVLLCDEELREPRTLRVAQGQIEIPAGAVAMVATIAITYRRQLGMAGRDSS